MADYRYRILNVFATEGNKFSGNPLCVFEDAYGLDDATMGALAGDGSSQPRLRSL